MQALIFLLLIVLMWVVLIVPRQREMRRHAALMRQLKVGDEVMMGSGIYGTIREMEGDFATLEVAPGVELKVARRAIAAKVPAEPEGIIDSGGGVVDLTSDDDELGDLDGPGGRPGDHGSGRPGTAGA
jgi:preprotein translocase subunit YajC